MRANFRARTVCPDVRPLVQRVCRVHVSFSPVLVPVVRGGLLIAQCSLNHAEITVVFATPEHIPALLKLAQKCPKLKMVVAMDPLADEAKKVLAAWGETVNVDVKEISECACRFTMGCNKRR